MVLGISIENFSITPTLCVLKINIRHGAGVKIVILNVNGILQRLSQVKFALLS